MRDYRERVNRLLEINLVAMIILISLAAMQGASQMAIASEHIRIRERAAVPILTPLQQADLMEKAAKCEKK